MSNTGFSSNLLNTSTTKDLINIYDSTNQSTIGGTATTGYKANSTDLGSIFTLYSNLSGAGYMGTQGLACGYKNSAGVDIGTLFVQKVTISTILPATGLLSSLPYASNCVGLYACKWVNNNYTGPILQLRVHPSTSDIIQDFYMNSSGTAIGMSLGGTGTTLASWLSSNSASSSIIYVVKWYDQSKTGDNTSISGQNHAVQTNNLSYQPTFDKTTNNVLFTTANSTYFNIPSTTLASGNQPFSITTKLVNCANIGSNDEAIFLFGSTGVGNRTEDWISNSHVLNAWYGNGACALTTSNPLPNNLVMTFSYNSSTNTRYIYYNQSATSTSLAQTGMNIIQSSSLSNNTISMPSTINGINASMSYLCIYNITIDIPTKTILEGI